MSSLMDTLGVSNRAAWNAASWFYANTTGAQAIVVVGAGGIRVSSTFAQVELPVLIERGIQIIYR